MPSGTTVYVTRFLLDKTDLPSYRTQKLGMVKPCQPILYRYNVTRIYYTDTIDGQEVLCELRRNVN